jgi:hypothetical protein
MGGKDTENKSSINWSDALPLLKIFAEQLSLAEAECAEKEVSGHQ